MADNVVRGITIIALERLRNTVNGNPRYRITFDNGLAAVSQSDAGFTYAITNPEYRDTPLDVTLTRAGRVSHVKVSEPAATLRAAELHKARPGDDPAYCAVCMQRIKRVPGGQGPTWIHADTGAVVAHGTG